MLRLEQIFVLLYVHMFTSFSGSKASGVVQIATRIEKVNPGVQREYI